MYLPIFYMFGILLLTICVVSAEISSSLVCLQSALSAAPEVNHTHGGYHHGIDMTHPTLALTVTIASISIKEG